MIRLLSGDARDVLPTLAAESVQCVVTSPPYLGLRDYGTALWDGGDAACDHRGAPQRTRATLNANWGDGYADVKNAEAFHPYRDTCGKCGAVRVDRQIGLEASPSEYLATMVTVFREIRRVLRPDGTCWVNMGDSYVSSASGAVGGNSVIKGLGTIAAATARPDKSRAGKPKDLLLMPARLALALQADGWWVRSDIIWHKPNPMPESCTDRPTSAHEHVFLLTRSARYFYDADAVREDGEGYGRSNWNAMQYKCGDITRNHGGKGEHGRGGGVASMEGGRNLRNVWTIATHAYPEAHFATFPPELAERCIKAGTSERGCCAACGKPWQRITSKVFVSDGKSAARGAVRDPGDNRVEFGADHGSWDVTTTGWSPGCQCGTTETRACVVLDPFIGAGTTALVADRLQRDVIGIDLNTGYTTMAMERCRADAPLFTSFPPAEPPEDERMADLFTDMAAD